MSVEEHQSIASFAIIDLETNELPAYQFNQCGITELSVCAFAVDCIPLTTKLEADNQQATVEVPALPRVMHKLTLMVNPMRRISDKAEELTGLNNDKLVQERSFDVHAADLLLAFLERLQHPVCLVAHNGWRFDFPVLGHVFAKIQKELPSTLLCVDTLLAFKAIDKAVDDHRLMLQENPSTNTITQQQQQPDENNINPLFILDSQTTETKSPTKEEETETETETMTIMTMVDSLMNDSTVNWQKQNESTPQRSLSNNGVRKRTPFPRAAMGESCTCKRRLFNTGSERTRTTTTWGSYKLANIYKRVFGQEPSEVHRAEGDVIILIRLILHYGRDFLDYAEQHAKSFDQVPVLGSL